MKPLAGVVRKINGPSIAFKTAKKRREPGRSEGEKGGGGGCVRQAAGRKLDGKAGPPMSCNDAMGRGARKDRGCGGGRTQRG